jgi:hypothetical protein
MNATPILLAALIETWWQAVLWLLGLLWIIAAIREERRNARKKKAERRAQEAREKREEEDRLERERCEAAQRERDEAPQREAERQNRKQEEQKDRELQIAQDKIDAEQKEVLRKEQKQQTVVHEARRAVILFHHANHRFVGHAYPAALLESSLLAEIPSSADEALARAGAAKLIKEMQQIVDQQKLALAKRALQANRKPSRPSRAQIEQEMLQLSNMGMTPEAVAIEIEHRYPGAVFEDAADTRDLYGS